MHEHHPSGLVTAQSTVTGASLRTEMKRYSILELLHMRYTLPAVNCVVHKLNKHPDIAAIFKIPEEALTNPDKYSCKSNALLNLACKHKPASVERRSTVGRSSTENDNQTFTGSNMSEYAQNAQWYLRQRDHSDHFNQPYSAPTGLAAQQSENFQRFYRAVVSPTHVRVTAGGRIVPNTRAAAPLELNWNGDKFLFEPLNPLRSNETQSLSPSLPWSNVSTLRPTLRGPSSIGSYSLYNFLPQLSNPGFATMTAQDLQENRGFDQSPYESAQSYVATETSSAPADPKQNIASPKPITLSPPTQFDHSKPFLYNGQWVYPISHGLQPAPPNNLPFPIPMLGNPNFVQPLPVMSANNFFTTHGPTTLSSFNHALGVPSNLHPLQMIVPSMQPVPLPTSLPALVSVSDMTKFHVQSLRNNLKFIENQLANNRHQIDEGYMEAQRQATVAQIDKLEAMLQLQLNQDSIGTTPSLGNLMTPKLSIKVAVTADNQTKGAAPGRGGSVRTSEPKVEVAASKSSMQKPANVEPGVAGKKTDDAQDSRVAVKPEPSTSKSRLIAAAARAPEFQPRNQVLATASSQKLSIERPVVVQSSLATQNPSESDLQIESRLLSRSSEDWTQPSNTGGGLVNSHTNALKSNSIGAPSLPQATPVPTFLRLNTFHGQSTRARPALVPPLQTQPIPYLVGVLPHNVQVNEAKATDLIYPRPLTDEELRARHLYWGKAPRSAQSGLPKFDGKDFYPPSPQKGSTLFRHSPPSKESASKCHSRPASTDLGTLFTDLSGQSYSTPSPLRHATSLHSMVPAIGSSFFGTKRTNLGAQRKNASTEFLRSAVDSPSSATVVPSTPLSRFAANPGTAKHDDFSRLFMERGVPGYRSPSPVSKEAQIHIDGVVKKSGVLACVSEPSGKEFQHNKSVCSSVNDCESNSSSVEIKLTSQVEADTAREKTESSFSERIANLSSVEQQTQFLQNMLRSTAQTTLAAPALSGTVSSTTAQGYLPQYRGTAAASLAPAMLNLPTSDIEAERLTSKGKSSGHPNKSFAPLIASNFLPENRPLNRDRVPRAIHPLLESMNAETYMRSISRKVDDDLKVKDHGWEGEASGIGPVIGSNW